MGEITGIAWCDHTFNGWIGCTRVSPACDRCYAASLAKRTGRRDRHGRDLWHAHAERVRTSPAYWQQPHRWNRDALASGIRRRVFCASMADVFDNHAPAEWRSDLWELIRATPGLDWLMLTKRPQNIAGMLPAAWGEGWANVWLGSTAENNTEAARRLPHLIAIPAKVHFVSAEPLIERLDLAPWLDRLDWVITGGESGGGARPMQPGWARDLRDQVQASGGAWFMKQTGSNRAAWPGVTGHGTDPAQWPEDLRIQDFPQPV